jgi:hypothetical protein
MTEIEKRQEIKRLLIFIYQEWPKQITESLISYWLEGLRGFATKPEAWIAARYLTRSKTYGEPKLRDLCEIINQFRKHLHPTKFESIWDLESPALDDHVRTMELARKREHDKSNSVPAEIITYIESMDAAELTLIGSGKNKEIGYEYATKEEAKELLGKLNCNLLPFQGA